MKIISPNYNVPKITTATESLEILHFESRCCRRFPFKPFTRAITHGRKFNGGLTFLESSLLLNTRSKRIEKTLSNEANTSP